MSKLLSLASFAVVMIDVSSALADRLSLSVESLQQIVGPELLSQHIDLSDPNQRRDIAGRLLGHGFDVWLQKATPNRCVQYPSNFVSFVSANPSVPNPNNWSAYVAVNNFSESSSSQSAGGSLSLTYKAFSLGASHSAAQSNSFSSYSSYISVDKGLVGDSASLITPHDAKTQILANDTARTAIKTSGAEFARICGQAYVARVLFGERIAGSLDYTTMMNGNASSNSTAVSAGVAGIITGSFSSAQQYAELSTKATLNYRVSGGPAQDSDPSKWLDDIRKYGSDGHFNDSKAVIVIDTNPYSGIPEKLFSDFIDADQIGQGTVLNLRAEFMNGIQLLSDLIFAQQHSAQFTKTPAPLIAAQIKTMSKYLDDVGDVYTVCRAAVSSTTAKDCKDKANSLSRPDYIPTPQL